MLAFIGCNGITAKVNTEKTISVDSKERKYILYVPDNVSENPPLVFSLHGAAGHDTDRSPFRTSVADAEGCIVVYPQGNDQFFPVFGGYMPAGMLPEKPMKTLSSSKPLSRKLVMIITLILTVSIAVDFPTVA